MERVLVIDDDDIGLEIIRSVLVKESFEVDTFTDPAAALWAFRERGYDMVVSDFYMPEMDGDQVLRHVRDIDKDVPFLFLTGNTDVKLAIALMKSGADDHIVKPIVAEELVFRVRKNLRDKHNLRLARDAENERALMELEREKLVNWRALYAAKDIAQTEQMISMLSRTINQAGGFLWIDLLKGTMEEADDGRMLVPREVLDMVLTSAESQKSIFDYITFIGSVDEMPLDKETMRVADFFTELAHECKARLDSLAATYPRSHTVVRPKAAPAGTIEVDRQLILRVVHELLINAVKYSPDGSRIIVYLEENTGADEPTLNIAVRNEPKAGDARDSGGRSIRGIPYQFSELVFDLFYTIESYPIRVPEEEWSDGTGLYLCRKLVRRHNGWVQMNNGVDYTGTVPEPFVRFTVTLPYKRGVQDANQDPDR